MLSTILDNAQTHYNWTDKKVSEELLHELYEHVKWGPTSFNCCPMRIIFIQSQAEKEKLKPCLMEANIEKTIHAPITAIIAEDTLFYEKLPQLMPIMDVKGMFENNPELAQSTRFRNATLQAGYFILAARGLGLDCGPMSGFNNQMVDDVFLKDTSYKSNFLCNLGYGDHSKLYPRLPRLTFDEACRII
jgi:3-hydroxypropanoate dehydrogenase